MAKKTIILVRHGQYERNPDEKLTKLGIQQAKLTGKRLRDFGIKKIHHSTLPRAIETAEIIQKELGFKKSMLEYDELRECVPGFPKKLRKKYGHTDEKKLKHAKHKLNRAFKKIFTFSKRDTTELVVAHGNVIRYLLAKSINVETDTWFNFDIKQCGITIIVLGTKSKSMTCIAHGDVGHIPFKMQTFI